MKQSTAPSQVSFLASYIIILILCLLPFSALLATWAGSNFGHLDAFRIWKEFLMIPLGVYAAVLVIKRPRLRTKWAHSWIVWLVLLYGLLFVGFGFKTLMSHQTTTPAILESLIGSLRFLWFMLVVWAVTDANDLIYRQWAKLVLIPASLVIAFGVTQRFLLPADFLRHFGYGPKTIPAIETVDQKLQYRRIQSSLRGANPLGAYLVIVLTTAIVYVRRKPWLWLLIGFGLVTLLLSFSRSAALGLLASLVFLGWHKLPHAQTRRILLMGGVVVIVAIVSLVYAGRHTGIVQNTLFHTDQTSQTSSSNAQRSLALRQGLHDIEQEPLGRGPGTAGPASARNNGQARLAENYYLQLGQEVGVIGMVIFIVINILIGWQLWRRTDLLASVLLASLVGITVINLISHAWADDTLSLLWWGLAGAALAQPVILKRKHHEQKAKTSQA
jgi:hypothetical protein